ncbi:PREDICTED: uncharacterized protein LOC108448775 isoform X1 [Corvus brachyrhynchos]|uniref:uncharacterized protein LOC108448775 isoform X1 n=1 Tax=Corvus brachyrhynchos TaxID=85066 RepID=UPI000816755D|nr:PREDICTED: uncharacterized protein LOC108448775 isoform X1 [Corvus brachyrhynchos]
MGRAQQLPHRSREMEPWTGKMGHKDANKVLSVLKSAITLVGAENFIADGGKGKGLLNSLSSGCSPTTEGTNRLSSFVPGHPTPPDRSSLQLHHCRPAGAGGAGGVAAAAVSAEIAAPRADPLPPACQSAGKMHLPRAKVWVQDLLSEKWEGLYKLLLGGVGMLVFPQVLGYDGYLQDAFALACSTRSRTGDHQGKLQMMTRMQIIHRRIPLMMTKMSTISLVLLQAETVFQRLNFMLLSQNVMQSIRALKAI